jgi:hypothetical protein
MDAAWVRTCAFVKEGDVGAGDTLQIVDKPIHGVTLRSMTDALRDPAKAAALRQVSRLPSFWRRVAEGRENED